MRVSVCIADEVGDLSWERLAGSRWRSPLTSGYCSYGEEPQAVEVRYTPLAIARGAQGCEQWDLGPLHDGELGSASRRRWTDRVDEDWIVHGEINLGRNIPQRGLGQTARASE